MLNKVYSVQDIKELLPYDYPMLLVDRFWQEDENKFVGLKNVSYTEEYFQGHFPDHPIMPGVLQVEATQQVATLAVKDKLDPNNELDIYAKSIKSVKFRKPTEPGDRLLIEVEVLKIENGEALIKAVNKHNSGICCQVQLTLATRPRSCEVVKPELFTEFDKDADIAMGLDEIKFYIPHRYPFLFIDYVSKVENDCITAIKNVTYNDPIMHSYSKGYSVLSEAIQAEIMAQAGAAHALSLPENKGKLAFFMTISNAEFYHPIHPGDQLRIELTVPATKSKFGKGSGKIFVENRVVSQGEITFAIVTP